MREKIENIIIEALKDFEDTLGEDVVLNLNSNTRLYGANGILDSLALVSLIADLEDKISQIFDKDIVLADEKAMSQKTSPFRSIESLALYIENLLKD